MSEQKIRQLFNSYVEQMQDTERHTEEACKEVNNFDDFCSEKFKGNIALQSDLYDKMMNCAVEYEESGFIAGFKMAMQMLYDSSVKVVA